jgi:uncharacterized protein YecT (DUF1311 family)
MDTRAAVFVFSMMLTSSATWAGSAAQDFGVQRRVVEPKLTFSSEPALCEAVLASATQVFDSNEFNVEPPPLTAALSWIDAFDEPPPGALSESRIGRLDLDLDGTGRKQVVIYRDASFNWSGNWHYAYVFPDAATFDAARAGVREHWYSTPGDQYPEPEKSDLGGRMYYPRALPLRGSPIGTGDVWARHSLFEWQGRYYFFMGLSGWDRHFDESTDVFRLHANGTVEKSCQVNVPDSESASKSFAALPAVASFLEVIRRVGAGGEDCGTAHYALTHDEGAKAMEWRAAIRPWVAARQNARRDAERIPDFLAAWGAQEIWNRREYRTLQQHVGPAEDAIAKYLVTRFGLAPELSQARAKEVVLGLLSARLLIPEDYGSSLPSRPLQRAIFNRDRAALEAAIADPRPPAYSDLTAKDALSAALSDAVEWQYGLERLLRAGADPNYPNDFGKTPLMVAAHMNRIDSVRKLLKAGAHASVWTQGRSSSCGEASITPRAALAYAAENASPLLIKMLAEADGSPDWEWGDRPLKLNPRLTAEEREGGIATLLTHTATFRGPSFNCSNARSKTEKAICGSEVLRIFDAEMARAYEQLRLAAASNAADSQRQWLRERDRECADSSGGDFADCLAEMTRTRIRYLHNRLRESP